MKAFATFVLLGCVSTGICAQPADNPRTVTPEGYASPGARINIATSRSLNLRCVGNGPGTVLLEAGSNADSTTWFRVQALLSPHARVCAYDRAGYGFSDEGPLPRNLEADVSDLAALIKAAKLETPLVLAGHSLGSNIVRRYAQVHPENVSALVLVDPPQQGAEGALPEYWKRQEEASRMQRSALLDACLKAAETGQLGKAEGPLASCLRAPPSWQSAPVAAATRAYKVKPSYWRTLRSELEANIEIFASPVPADEAYGDIPVILLAARDDTMNLPGDVQRALQEARKQTHARLVAASPRGRRIDVPEGSHDLQIDASRTVSEAILGQLVSRP